MLAAMAPMAAQAADASAEAQTVIVTGSRIPQPNLNAISPVSVITSEDIKSQGATRVEDIVNTLPQAFAAQGSTISNGASGTATVNLRGLGSARTLVLIDGRRLVPGDPGSSAADLNFIPSSLIDRVDVETGGASATYGADAVAGVVNFVMKKNFQGIEIDAQYNTYQHDNGNSVASIVQKRGFALPSASVTDGRGYEISAIIGANTGDGKGNVSLYATYRQINPILQAARDFSACTLGESGSTTFACGGSSTSYPGRFVIGGSSYTINSATGNTFTPYSSALNAYNYGPLNYFQRPDERYTFGGYAHYELNEHIDAYSQIMFADDDTVAQIAPGGVFFGPQTVNCDNPLMSASQQSLICGAAAGTPATQSILIGRRNVEGGGRQNDIRHTEYRILEGVKGALDKTWSYDAYLLYGTSILQTSTLNYFLNSRIARALIVKNVGGVPTCQSVIDGSDPSCVPYNLYQIGGVTPAALAYLQAPSFAKGTATEKVGSVNFTGALGNYGVRSPYATDGVGVNVGAEYREEAGKYAADFLATSGDLSGAGGASPPVTGSYNVWELYGEALVPLIQGQQLVDSLDFSGGYRYSDYSSVGRTNTYKAGLDWKVNSELKFRASYNRAVRAPNINELYSPQNVVLDGSHDPCAGTMGVGSPTPAQCAQSGVTAAQYGTLLVNPASQYNGLTGGNPKLNPETSDTYSFGAIVQPSFVPGLILSVDYFDIKVKDFIGGVGADTIINLCVYQNQYCSQVHRDSFGSLWITPQGYIQDTTLNTGSLETKGVDVNGSYKFSLDNVGLKDMGRVKFDWVATYLDSYKVTPLPGGGSYDCAGLYGLTCGTPSPHWRGKVKTTWNTPWWGLNLSAQWRYFGSVTLDAYSNNPLLNTPGNQKAQEAKFGEYNYIDLGANIKLHDHYNLRVGVNNVFDKDPPIVGSANCSVTQCNGNTYPQVYDALGRYFFAQISIAY
jgi:iron complex outermembrane receptor protein